MPLTFPAPSMALRQAFELAQQIYQGIHEMRELADGEENLEEELDQLHTSLNALIHTMNQELHNWQQLALTASRELSGIVRFEKQPNALLTGFLEGSISVRTGMEVRPLTQKEVFGIDTWMPVHREKSQEQSND